MTTTTGRFRVYRVFESVPHLNFLEVDADTLYTVYQSGYEDQQQVDDLRTGDLIEATLSGDQDATDEPWRIETVEQCDGVTTDFVVDAAVPMAASTNWEADRQAPLFVGLGDERPVGVCAIQPRAPLPRGAFVPNVLTGLLPLEELFESLPMVEEPAAEALFVDPDPPGATTHGTPYGVALLFTEGGRPVADRYRDAYDLPRGADSRPDYDPYGI